MPLTPIAVKRYSANLTQTGTNAPTANVLENTLGFTPTWLYDVTGAYYTTNAAFSETKTWVEIQSVLDNGPTKVVAGIQGNIVYVNSSINNTLANDLLINTSIEIRIYL